jgi:uncharacterized membrane protein
LSDNPGSLLLFLGRFHPLLVHLPIGGLVLLVVLEFLSCMRRWKNVAQNSLWILGFVCATVWVSTACGWLLAQSGEYDSHLLQWHQGLGLALTAACLLTFLLRRRQWVFAYRASLFTTLVLLVITGHLGGSISHGNDFLTRYCPLRGKDELEQSAARRSTPPTARAVLNQPVFAGIIEPILQQRCCGCHGPQKHKADLRLDTMGGLMRGGQDGLVIKAGHAKESPLVQCMLSPWDSDGHMPPEDHPQATPEEIVLIEWWVNIGAPPAQKLSDLEPNAEIERLVELVSSGRDRRGYRHEASER